MAKRRRTITPHPRVRHITTGHFDEGLDYRAWRPGGTDDHLLIYTVAGAGRIGWSGGHATITAGDLLLYEPNTRHDYRTDAKVGRWELRWAHFRPRPHWHPWLDWPAINAGSAGIRRLAVGDVSMRRRIEGTLAEAHAVNAGPMHQAAMFALNALERVLLLADQANPRTTGRPLDDRVQAAVDHLRDHLDTPVSLDELAGVVYLSSSRLSHLFREQVGLSPLQYHLQLRIERARQLLELTRHPIQAIADRVGFDSPFYFSAQFKRQTGVSPRDYRRQHQGAG